MALIKCPECGKEVSDEAGLCPHCGYEITEQNENLKEDKQEVPIYKNRKYMGRLMCIVGCILLIVGITRITNDDYKFYKQHYKDCIDGYNDTKTTANSYVGGYFKSTYNDIASNYQDMADDDNKKLWTLRIQAIFLLCGGSILILGGYKNCKKEKEDHGIN
jgi:hypothetical protein